ncbi:MAG: Polysaccharide biosynthesis/export protein, partial [Roseomonas sp.]|nr:Polysaccharide biosynthesis/export protein [Roseomonas sp.]
MSFFPPGRGLRTAGLPVALVAALLGAMPPGMAQMPPGGTTPSPLLSPPALPSMLPGGIPVPALPPSVQQDILQRILDASGSGRPGPASPVPQPAMPPRPLAMPSPASPAPAEMALSNTEAFYAARLDLPLRQFGYDTFHELSPMGPAPATLGTLPDNYVLGRDDEVMIAIRGRTRQSVTLRVNRDGTLLLPDLLPFPAAGRTLRELRADIGARVAQELGGSEAFVSVGQVRQIGVFVAGEVVRPGMQSLPALASALDALALAGGVRKTGSLRAIRIEGPNGRRIIDLYSVIAGEDGNPDLMLREGERLVVPALGATVAMAGEVTRPGIYELAAGQA